jgi:hypothetical protein
MDFRLVKLERYGREKRAMAICPCCKNLVFATLCGFWKRKNPPGCPESSELCPTYFFLKEKVGKKNFDPLRWLLHGI